MLNRLSIKQKLILIMSIPLIVVVLLSSRLYMEAYNKKHNVEHIEKIVVLSTKIGAFVHETQKERGMTAGYLGSKGQKFSKEIVIQRKNADAKKSDFLNYLKTININDYDKNFQLTLDEGLKQLKNIENIRQSVTSLSIPTGQAIGYYTKMNGLFLNTIAFSTHLSEDIQITKMLSSYTNFLLAKERAGIERAVGSNTFARDNFGEGMKVKFNNLVAEQNAYTDSFLKIASQKAKDFFKETLKGESVEEVNRMRSILFAKESGFGIEAKYWFDTITKKINLLKKVENFLADEIITTTKAESKNATNETITIAILTLIIILVTILIVRMILNRLINDLNLLKDGLDDFFKFINFEKDDVQAIKINSQDEFGHMSEIINKNIEETKLNFNNDKDLISNTISVADQITKGHLGIRIEKSSHNPNLNELTKIINGMFDTWQQNIEKIMTVLTSYAKLDYRPSVDKGNLEGTLEELCDDVNLLGKTITKTLIDNTKNGKRLKDNSDTLIENLNEISQAANTQAASLEETAASIEELTANIQQNSLTTTEMASYGLKVSESVKIGHDLANNTVKAMEEINEQTNSITEAITVIDQIAFQTNILSLNAAVEAATAGEAGKGFAVVAAEVRNLANRSAEAAREIKELVESAHIKTDEGKNIASKMIHGYDELNTNITKTINLIDNVSVATKEQKTAITQINDAISHLDKITQINAEHTSNANEISKQTGIISDIIVEDANSKEFIGKNEI